MSLLPSSRADRLARLPSLSVPEVVVPPGVSTPLRAGVGGGNGGNDGAGHGEGLGAGLSQGSLSLDAADAGKTMLFFIDRKEDVCGGVIARSGGSRFCTKPKTTSPGKKAQKCANSVHSNFSIRR